MKSKIYSSEYMKSSSKGQRWIPAFAMIAFLLAFPVAELILMGKWNERSYTQSQLSYLYSSLWSSDFLTMGAAVVAVTAFFAAVSGFWYLYSPRKVDFYHSLPVKRSTLFLHRVLLAVLYYLVPYVIMEFAAVCIGAARGYYSLSIMKKALILLVLHLLMYLLVYFSTVLVIACTGTMLMGALAWAGLFTYSIVLAVMLQLSGHLFFDTWYEGSYGILAAVRNLGSPLMVIVSFIDRYSSGSFGKQLLILILTLFIMAALSWMAFCRRRSENTGKALVYTWMEPVLSALITIPSGLGIGLIFYMIPEDSSKTAWWIFGMILGTILVHGILEVIYEMDFRRFFRRKVQLMIFGGVVAICALTMKMDLLGYDSYFPAYDNLQGVVINVSNLSYTEQLCNVEKKENGIYKIRYTATSDNSSGLLDQPVMKSKALYNSLKDIRLQNEKGKKSGRRMYVRYINKQGFSVCRSYNVSSAQAQNLMEALYDEQIWKENRYSFFQLDKQYLKEVTGIFCDGDIQTLFEKNAEKRQALAEALRKDILENGGQTVKDQPCAMLMFDYAGIPSEGYMDEWGMNVPAVQEGESVSTSVLVYPAYKRTLVILEETGYPLSMDKLSVEYIDVYYFSSEAAGEDDEAFSDTEPISDLEETDNGYKVRYDKKEQLEALKKCIRPSQLVNGWTIWNADATMEVVLEGQESTGGDSGLYMTFAGEIPDFIRADAKAAHVTEWEVND